MFVKNLKLKKKKKKRLLIYNGTLDLEVKDIDATQIAIKEFTKKSGGYVQKMDDRMIKVRIPAEKFNEVFKQLKGLGIVLFKEIITEDVTKQYYDLLLELENAIKAKNRLQELLKKAEKVEEILLIEKELQRLKTQIEMIKGSLSYLKDNILYSTIIVNYSLSPEILQARKAKGSSAYRTPFNWVNRLGLEDLSNF